jgi:hypothetical protein
MASVNTKSVSDRRTLRFESLDAALRDVDALVAAERAGTLRHTGNWTLGQTLGHLAFWANAPFDGYPPMRRPPWPIRVLMPLFKGRFLRNGLPAGFRIPGAEGGTFGAEPLSTDEGHRRVRAAFDRLGRVAPTHANPAMGPLSHEEWIALNLRHAELHLSFQHPK